MSNDLSQQECQPIASDSPVLGRDESEQYLTQLENGWQISEDGKTISRTFEFHNYYETVTFANAAAAVAHQQDHHPEISFSYNRCQVDYSTHSINGLSLNDFICAAKTDKALSQ